MPNLLRFALVFFCLFHVISVQGQSQRGQMRDGKPVGVWEYYDGKELGLRFNHDSTRIQYVRPDTSRYFLQVDGSWQLVRPTRAPRLMGSQTEVVSLLQKRLRYPVGDIRAHTTGTVIVSITIDEQGGVKDGRVTNAPSATLSNEVIRALQAVSLSYLPAVYQGKRVPFRVSFVVRFCFESENADGFAIKKQSELLPKPAGSFDEIIVVVI